MYNKPGIKKLQKYFNSCRKCINYVSANETNKGSSINGAIEERMTICRPLPFPSVPRAESSWKDPNLSICMYFQMKWQVLGSKFIEYLTQLYSSTPSLFSLCHPIFYLLHPPPPHPPPRIGSTNGWSLSSLTTKIHKYWILTSFSNHSDYRTKYSLLVATVFMIMFALMTLK